VPSSTQYCSTYGITEARRGDTRRGNAAESNPPASHPPGREAQPTPRRLRSPDRPTASGRYFPHGAQILPRSSVAPLGQLLTGCGSPGEDRQGQLTDADMCPAWPAVAASPPPRGSGPASGVSGSGPHQGLSIDQQFSVPLGTVRCTFTGKALYRIQVPCRFAVVKRRDWRRPYERRLAGHIRSIVNKPAPMAAGRRDSSCADGWEPTGSHQAS
jgi:hypothetical protein